MLHVNYEFTASCSMIKFTVKIQSQGPTVVVTVSVNVYAN